MRILFDEEGPTLWYMALKRRISATYHIPENGYRLRLTPECLMNNGCQRPIIHRLLQSSRSTRPTSLQDHVRHSPCIPSGLSPEAPWSGRQWSHLPDQSQLGRRNTCRCTKTPSAKGDIAVKRLVDVYRVRFRPRSVSVRHDCQRWPEVTVTLSLIE